MYTVQEIYTGHKVTRLCHTVLGMENKCTICEGKRPKKENAAIKYEKKWCVEVYMMEKVLFMYAPLFGLYFGTIT